MGYDFARGMVDPKSSMVLGAEQMEKIDAQLAAGDNVVLVANHQSEADPQIFSVLLDDSRPGFAEKTVFVAGEPPPNRSPNESTRHAVCARRRRPRDDRHARGTLLYGTESAVHLLEEARGQPARAQIPEAEA